MATEADANERLWTFALGVYQAAGVASACLALQDAFGADVCLLLFAAWAGAKGKLLSGDEVNRARAQAEPWAETVVRPLRDVRRRLKPWPESEAQRMRQEVKALELRAERIELAGLERLLRDDFGAAGGEDAISGNLRLVLPPNAPPGDALAHLDVIAAAARVWRDRRL